MNIQKKLAVAVTLVSGLLLGSSSAVAEEACGLGIGLQENEKQVLFFTNTDDEDDFVNVTALCGPLGAKPDMVVSLGTVRVPTGATILLSPDLSDEDCAAGEEYLSVVLDTSAQGAEAGAMTIHVLNNTTGATIAMATENCDD